MSAGNNNNTGKVFIKKVKRRFLIFSSEDLIICLLPQRGLQLLHAALAPRTLYAPRQYSACQRPRTSRLEVGTQERPANRPTLIPPLVGLTGIEQRRDTHPRRYCRGHQRTVLPAFNAVGPVEADVFGTQQPQHSARFFQYLV